MPKDRKAIVTFATGKKYLKNFNETFRPSVERYSKSINTDLVVVEEFIRPSSKHTFWQRLLMFSDPRIAANDKVLMIDADIYITKHAKNIFDAVGEKLWGISKNNAYDLPNYAITDQYYFNDCPKEGRPPFAANSGMYVMSRTYKGELEAIYDEYSERESRGYEAGPLFHFLYNDGKGIILGPEFNTLVIAYMQKYGHSLSAVLKMYDTSSFLHFAAGKWRSIFFFIRWFDNTESRFAKKVVRYLGTSRFDRLTSALFSVFQRAVGIYDYRIKKKLLGR